MEGREEMDDTSGDVILGEPSAKAPVSSIWVVVCDRDTPVAFIGRYRGVSNGLYH